MSTSLIHVRVTDEQSQFLEYLASTSKPTKSDLVREALNIWIASIQRLEQLGVVRAQ